MQTDCRYFLGDRPCPRNTNCDRSCGSYSQVVQNVLLVHLGALGAVVRSTSLLSTLRQKHPKARLFWLTEAPADRLLAGHPLLDGVFTTADLFELKAYNFEIAYCIDKSRRAAGLLRELTVESVKGFIVDPQTGSVLPATSAAQELWNLGLSNHHKFFVNSKPETQLILEALELGPWQRQRYDLPLLPAELAESQERRRIWSKSDKQVVIGLNTGCANTIAAKKWTVEFHRQVIQALSFLGLQNFVLLGGPEDTNRNQKIARGLPVAESPTRAGLRDGLISVEACDLVITGDSLGMHLAIARSKFTVAWFGPTCVQEIDLYDHGVKLIADVACSPCWKRSCDQSEMCYDRVSLEKILQAVEQGVRVCQANVRSSSSRLPFLETSSSVSQPSNLCNLDIPTQN